jgi:hypothetical protein
VQEVDPSAAHVPAPHDFASMIVGHSYPAGQISQVVIDVAPTAVEYSPAAHEVQGISPVADQVPAGHRLQMDSPALDQVFSGQGRQVEASQAPVAPEKVPAVHWVHEPAPAAANVPCPHETHVEMSTAPVAPEEVPAAHWMQVVALPGDHEPGPHGVESEVVGHSDPAGQGRQFALDVAPTMWEYSPTAHEVHGGWPVLDQVPAPHTLLN